MVTLKVLIENTALSENFRKEHGLSLYLETDTHKILFDTGKSDQFLANAQALGIDLSEADTAVISHGHYDHTGGLNTFLNLNKKAPVYINRQAFLPHFYGSQEYIGMDPTIIPDRRFVLIDDFLKIDDTLSLYSCNGMSAFPPVGNEGFSVLQQGGRMPDQFWREHYLLIRDAGRKILITGCSHKGILNLVNWFKPDVLVGGFHFMGLDPEQPKARKLLEHAAQTLQQYPTHYYTGHCTGSRQYDLLKEILGDQLHAISSGMCTKL